MWGDQVLLVTALLGDATDGSRTIGSGAYAALTSQIPCATEKSHCEFIREHTTLQDPKLVRFQEWLRRGKQMEDEELEKAKTTPETMFTISDQSRKHEGLNAL